MSQLSDPQRQMVEDAVQNELDARIRRDFGGSSARLDAHLAGHGLTLGQYRAQLEREMVVRRYTREKLMPMINVRRDELLSHYQENLDRYCSPETRELLIIEAPFPEGWRDNGLVKSADDLFSAMLPLWRVLDNGLK